jgi:CRP-like cAMP-binding protein
LNPRSLTARRCTPAGTLASAADAAWPPPGSPYDQRILESSHDSEGLARRVAALRRAPIFAHLPEESLRRIASSMSEVEVPEGLLLIEARTKGSGLFVIEEGSVVVQPQGRPEVELGPGEVVGELALLLPDESRTARVLAKTTVRCLTLDRHSFQQLLETEPRLAVDLLHGAVQRLSELQPMP